MQPAYYPKDAVSELSCLSHLQSSYKLLKKLEEDKNGLLSRMASSIDASNNNNKKKCWKAVN